MSNLPNSICPPERGTAYYPLTGYINEIYAPDAVWSVTGAETGGVWVDGENRLVITPDLKGEQFTLHCEVGAYSASKVISIGERSLIQDHVAWVYQGWMEQNAPTASAVDGDETTYWSAGKHSAGSSARLCIDTEGEKYNKIKLCYDHVTNSRSTKITASDEIITTVPDQSGQVTDSVPTLRGETVLYEKNSPTYEKEVWVDVEDTQLQYLMLTNGIESSEAQPFRLREISLYYAMPGELEICGLQQVKLQQQGERQYQIGLLLKDTVGQPMNADLSGVTWSVSAPPGVSFDSGRQLLTVADGAKSGHIILYAQVEVDGVTLQARERLILGKESLEVLNEYGNPPAQEPEEGIYYARAEGGEESGYLAFAAYREGALQKIVLGKGNEQLALELEEGQHAKAFYWSEMLAPLTYAESVNPVSAKATGPYSYFERTTMEEEYLAAQENAHSAVLMALDYSGVLLWGERARMKAKPMEEQGTLWIPIEAVQLAGGSIETLDETTVRLTLNGKEVTAQRKNENYIPAEQMAQLLDAQIFRMEDVIAFSDTQLPQGDWMTLLHYSRPKAAQVLQEVKSYGARPRILANQDVFDRIERELQQDENVKQWYNKLVQTANTYLTQPVTEYKIESNRLLNMCTQVYDRVSTLGFVYRMTGETKYAQRAWEELEAAAEFPDWHPSHFLDVGEMSLAFAVGYDWLSDFLAKPQKMKLVSAFEEKGLEPFVYDVNRGATWTKHTSNWNSWIRNGVISCILSMAEDLNDTGAAQFALEEGMVGLEGMLEEFKPKGAWVEGTAYWEVAVRFLVQLIDAFEYSTGRYWGYDNLPGMDMTGYFSAYLSGPGGTFNFSDTTITRDNPAVEFWMANRFDMPQLRNLRLQNMTEYNLSSSLLDILWYVPDDNDELPKLERDMFYENIDIAAFHNGWAQDSLFAALKGADTAASHHHYDGGGFVFDIGGKRFAYELGRESYAVSDGDVNIYQYKKRAEGHNTLVINPSADPGQRKKTQAEIIEFEQQDTSRHAIVDLTPMYLDQGLDDGYTGEDIRRGMKVYQETDTIVVQDEVHLTEESEMYWFMHTKAEIDVDEDGRGATLTLDGVSIRAQLLGDENASFTVMPAFKLDTTPDLPGQGTNPGFRKLAIHWEKVKDTSYAVVFTPVDSKEEVTFTPLGDW